MRSLFIPVLMLALTLPFTARAQTAALRSAPASSDHARTLWLQYQYAKMDDARSIDALEQAMRRAAQVGYRYVSINPFSITRQDAKPERYRPNIERIKKLAQELDMEIVPKVFDIGYSVTMLSHDVLMGGYYDSPMDQNVATWLNAAGDNPKVKGIMYATYKHDFTNLEKYAQKIKEYKLSKD